VQASLDPVARAARLPGLVALNEARRYAKAGLGASELPPLTTSPKRCVALADLLAEAGETPLAAAGDLGVQVTGVADVVDLIRPGDLAILAWSNQGAEAAAPLLAEVASHGAKTAVLCGVDVAEKEAARGLAAEMLAASGGLQSVVLLSSGLAAAGSVALAFFDNPATRLRCVMVAGFDAIEVRTATWLLSCTLEARHGAAATGSLNSRRTSIGIPAVDVGHCLTPCIVQELLAEMVATGIEICVVEALPGAQSTEALTGIEFDIALDLRRSISSSAGSSSSCSSDAKKLRETNMAQLLQQVRGGRVISLQPHDAHAEIEWAGFTDVYAASLLPPPLDKIEMKSKDEKKLKQALGRLGVTKSLKKTSLNDALQALLGMQLLPPVYCCKNPQKERKQLLQLKKGQLMEWCDELNLSVVESEFTKKDLVELIMVHKEIREIEAEQNLSAPAGFMRGKVRRTSTVGKTQLVLATESCGRIQVDLPILGISGASAALAVACLGLEMYRGDGLPPTQETLNTLRDALQSATSPPGTLELLTAAGTDDPRVLAVLHEATSLEEVVQALQTVREWRCLDGNPLSLTVVIGCEGELRRGDRAKLGWALAEFCDRVVLTSNHPRAEPPMQILEDVLEAIRGRVPRHLGLTDCLPLAREVHIVADRTDAIKLAISSSTRQTLGAGPGIVLIFGSTYNDVQEIADVDGGVRQWLCNDRRIIIEALEVTERICKFGQDAGNERMRMLDMSQVPWSMSKDKRKGFEKLLTLPGQSLHWTYDIHMNNKGEIEELL